MPIGWSENYLCHICDLGCEENTEVCRGDYPYLCQRSAFFGDTAQFCVAKGFDWGCCGGRNDLGLLHKCELGALSPEEVDEKYDGDCDPRTPEMQGCGDDEYCCLRYLGSNSGCKKRQGSVSAIWFTIEGIADPDAVEGVDGCTSTIQWQVQERCEGVWRDISDTCEEAKDEGGYGSMYIKVDPAETLKVSCTSEEIPPGSSGEHCVNVTWCGESKLVRYGSKLVGELSDPDGISTGECSDGEVRVFFRQADFDGCDDVLDEDCVGRNDDPDDSACCVSESYCVFEGTCVPDTGVASNYDYSRDIDGDGVYGEYCEVGEWHDADSDPVFCEWSERYVSMSGESVAFGEYESFGETECCGDDAGEVYVEKVLDSGETVSRCCADGHNTLDDDGDCISQMNHPPMAEALAGFTRSEAKQTASLRLDEGMRFFGSGSSDPDGSIVWYTWDFGDGEAYEGPDGDTSHVYAGPGKYTAELTVRDNLDAETQSEHVMVTVHSPPTAVARVGRSMDALREGEITIRPGDNVTLDASASASPNGEIVRYTWIDFESDNTLYNFVKNGRQLDIQYSFVGVYRVHLWVEDVTGSRGYDNVTIKVEADPENMPPEARIISALSEYTLQARKAIGDVQEEIKADCGSTVHFDASLSSPQGGIVRYVWDFGDGQNAEGVKTSHMFLCDLYEISNDGNASYTVKLYVYDEVNRGDVSNVTVNLTGSFYELYHPEILAGVDPENLADAEEINAGAGERVYFKATALGDDDENMSYRWAEVEKDGEKFMLKNILGKGDIMSRKFDPGTYHIQFAIVDPAFNYGVDVVTVNVRDRVEEVTPGFRILFVPFDWQGDLRDSDVDSLTGEYVGYLREVLPLKECPETISYVNSYDDCRIEMPTRSRGECIKYDGKWSRYLQECAIATGEDYDYVVGLTNKEVCGNIDGRGIQNTDLLWIQTLGPSLLAHEMGHKYGLLDEYYDACRCDGLSGPNCLETGLDGDDSIWPGLERYCSGGSECEKETPLCLGNRNDGGGRCIMSSDPLRPQAFCDRCMEHLSGIPELQCAGEVVNKPPVPEALAGFTRSEAKQTASLRLDEGMRFFGSGSNDPDGSIVWYKWDFGDGETYEGAEGDTAHLYTEHGTYTAKLTVKDDDDLEVESEPVTVTVYEPPTAVARVGRSMDDLREGEITIDAAELQMAEKIVFDGSESHSPNGDIVRYMWLEYESGERYIDFTLIGPEVQKEIRFPGEYTVHLEVMDSVGAKGYDSLLVDITSDPATTPIAEAYVGTSADDMTHKEISAHYGQEIYFNGLGSRSPDGRSIGCFWEFGDYSARGLSFLAAHTYEFHPQGGLEQEYTVTLYVAAESGPMVRDMVKVKLTRPLENEYIAIVKAGTDPENLVPAEELNVNELQRVYFDCSESDTGEERKCIWDEVDEALDWVRTIGTGDITSSKFKPGIHYVQLRAYDGVGDFGEALLTIDVEDRPEEAERGFTLLYIPFDWEGSLDGFDDLARGSAGYIVDHLPLKDCPEKLEYFSAVENCILDMPKEGFKKSDARQFCRDEADVWAYLLKSCAEKTGHDYDYIIGVTNQDVCGQADGMSLLGSDFLWFEAGSLGRALHELGHNWGLRDEYFDACRCWNLSGPNCLIRELDGADSIWPGFEAYCEGGSKCKSESQMAMSLCKGNRNVYGGRCIMAAEPYRPTEFCPVCTAHLKTIPQLTCGGVENG